MPHNKALQLTNNPLRGLSAAELDGYASTRRGEGPRLGQQKEAK